ncbi:MAG: hypothetical protein HC918_09095, partial [Oscillatoriales cyanobacterium SM2_1_8]|nr:hypothetical protein [Oscillatoriales cyanobacterium SM2_1_8]
MTVAPPSERWLREWAAEAAWSWGERYAHTVTDLTWRDPMLSGRVGTSVVRRVEVSFAEGCPATATLDGQPTAPTRQKYVLAMLIHWARHPEALTVRPPLADWIATLSLPQAQQLLQDLSDQFSGGGDRPGTRPRTNGGDAHRRPPRLPPIRCG